MRTIDCQCIVVRSHSHSEAQKKKMLEGNCMHDACEEVSCAYTVHHGVTGRCAKPDLGSGRRKHLAHINILCACVLFVFLTALKRNNKSKWTILGEVNTEIPCYCGRRTHAFVSSDKWLYDESIWFETINHAQFLPGISGLAGMSLFLHTR